MFPSLISSLQRVAITPNTPIHHALLRSTTTITSSSSIRLLSSSAVPPIKSNKKSATPQQIAQAKERIISPSNPRARAGNNLDRRTFPIYRGLPTNNRHKRDPTENPETGRTLYPSKVRYDTGVTPGEMPYLHHFGHDEKPKPKFKSPRKRASKLYNELQMEAAAKSRESKPAVWDVPFKVGDAIEIGVLEDGGVHNPNNKKLDFIRGVVLGRHNRGLDTGIYVKDVLFGDHVERKVKLHSPMIKTLKVLEEGFVNRGKKKGRRVKRAKLYYLRDRKPEETRVTNPQK